MKTGNRHQARGNSKRIQIVGLFLCVLLITHCLPAQAQQSKVARIGWLGVRGSGSGSEAFRQQFRDLGYIDGKNTTIEYRYAENRLDRLPALADELIGLRVDVLVTPAMAAAFAAKNATKTIPIVFFNVSDPLASGLVGNLARPGGNITGVSNIAAVLAGKRLELLKETIPKLSRVALLWNPGDPSSALQWKESQESVGQLGLQLHSMEADSTGKYEAAFKQAMKAQATALAVTQHSLANSNQKRIADLATQNRLPAIYARQDFAESGGLMSYGAYQFDMPRRAAVYVDKILKGAKPADLPVEQPTKFELVINLKAAKQIGLTIPPNVLARADKVIR